jgi:hypothetical protein
MQATFNVTETIQDIHVWNAAIRSKRALNPAALAKIGRRRELDTLRALIIKEVMFVQEWCLVLVSWSSSQRCCLLPRMRLVRGQVYSKQALPA